MLNSRYNLVLESTLYSSLYLPFLIFLFLCASICETNTCIYVQYYFKLTVPIFPMKSEIIRRKKWSVAGNDLCLGTITFSCQSWEKAPPPSIAGRRCQKNEKDREWKGGLWWILTIMLRSSSVKWFQERPNRFCHFQLQKAVLIVTFSFS